MTINNNALKRKERGCIVAFRWSEWRWQIGLVVSTGSRPSVYPVGLLTSVKNALVSTTLGGLSLLLLLDLGGLRLNLSGTSERSVNLSHFEVTLVRFRCKKLSSFATHKRGGTDPGGSVTAYFPNRKATLLGLVRRCKSFGAAQRAFHEARSLVQPSFNVIEWIHKSGHS